MENKFCKYDGKILVDSNNQPLSCVFRGDNHDSNNCIVLDFNSYISGIKQMSELKGEKSIIKNTEYKCNLKNNGNIIDEKKKDNYKLATFKGNSDFENKYYKNYIPTIVKDPDIIMTDVQRKKLLTEIQNSNLSYIENFTNNLIPENMLNINNINNNITINSNMPIAKKNTKTISDVIDAKETNNLTLLSQIFKKNNNIESIDKSIQPVPPAQPERSIENIISQMSLTNKMNSLGPPKNTIINNPILSNPSSDDTNGKSLDNIINHHIINSKKKTESQKINTFENAGKCKIPYMPNNKNMSYVGSGEVCTIQTAKSYGIFDEINYFNNKLTEDDKYKIDINSSNERPYRLCNDEKNFFVQNCVLSTKNPWKTYNSTYQKCMLPDNIKLPEELKIIKPYISESSNIDNNKIEFIKPQNVPFISNTEQFCQERWYDWFIIPDYDLGNRFRSEAFQVTKDDGTKERKSVCYKPCPIKDVPELGDPTKCISKDKFNLGKYANTFYYSPVALILLLGSTKESLLEYYGSNFDLLKKSLSKNSAIQEDIYLHIQGNNETKENIYKDIKGDIKSAINELFKYEFTENNIVVPNKDLELLSRKTLNVEKLRNAYNIAYNYSTIYSNIEFQNSVQISTSNQLQQNSIVKWFNSLSDVSGYDVNSDQFKRQLICLKKACNLAFDGSTDYSKNFILHSLNINCPVNERKTPCNCGKNDKNNVVINNVDTVCSTNTLIWNEKEKSSIFNEPKNSNEDIQLKNIIMLAFLGACLIVLFFIVSILLKFCSPIIVGILNNTVRGFVYFLTFIETYCFMSGCPTVPLYNYKLAVLQNSWLEIHMKKISSLIMKNSN